MTVDYIEEETVAEPDATMTQISEGIELSQRGERAAARRLFARIWTNFGGEHGDPLYRCALAHSMADVQEDVHEELVWDLRTLAATELITDERLAHAGVPSSAAGFYPSLHLNLGECYRRLGDLDRARQHLERGRAAVGSLGDGGYGRMIQSGIDRLADRLAARPQEESQGG